MRTEVDGAVALLTTDEPVRVRAEIRTLAPSPAEVELWALTSAPQERLVDEIGAHSPRPTITHLVGVRGAQARVVDEIALLEDATDAWACATTRVIGEPIRDDDVARIAFVRRRHGFTHDEFLAHYFGVHIPMVLDAGPLFTRYTIRATDDGPWDAVVEQVFPSMEVWNEHDRRLFEEKIAIRDDLHGFIGEVHQFAAVPLNPLAR